MTSEVYGAKVRLKFSILINFVMRILSLSAGLLFTISVTRKLSVEDFGTWTMLFKYISYVLPFAAIFSYWLPRTISRGFNTAKAGLFLSIILGLTASIAYMFIGWGASTFFNQPLIPLLIATIIVLQEYLYRGLLNIALAHAPQYRGIAIFTIRAAQAISALGLVVFLRLGLYGAVIAAIIGRSCGLLLLFVVNSKVISSSVFDFSIVKGWIRKSWLPLYGNLVLMLSSLDVLIIRGIVGSEEPIAYYGISMSVLGIAMMSVHVSPALYARLLAKRDVKDVFEAFWVSYMLLIPMVIGIFVYTKPILAIYNIKYTVAVWIVRLFALAALFRMFSTILATTLGGFEYRDLVENISLRETVLFKTPTLRLVITAIYLLVIVTTSYIFGQDSLVIGSCWGFAYLLRFLLLTCLLDRLLRKEFNIRLPYSDFTKTIAKFLLSSLTIVVLSMLFPVEPQISIWKLLEDFVPILIISVLAYFSTLYLVDTKFRTFFKTGVRYVVKEVLKL